MKQNKDELIENMSNSTEIGHETCFEFCKIIVYSKWLITKLLYAIFNELLGF